LYIDRHAGFEKAMRQNNVTIYDRYVFYHELNAENARKSLHQLFAKKPYPDAVFASNDVTALAALEFAKELKIQVPSEFKIVGYSNDPRSSITSPSITTIEQFPGQIGKVIVRELLRILQNHQQVGTDATPILTPVQLLRRMST
jgi:LacI family transcriptional regulator